MPSLGILRDRARRLGPEHEPPSSPMLTMWTYHGVKAGTCMLESSREGLTTQMLGKQVGDPCLQGQSHGDVQLTKEHSHREGAAWRRVTSGTCLMEQTRTDEAQRHLGLQAATWRASQAGGVPASPRVWRAMLRPCAAPRVWRCAAPGLPGCRFSGWPAEARSAGCCPSCCPGRGEASRSPLSRMLVG